MVCVERATCSSSVRWSWWDAVTGVRLHSTLSQLPCQASSIAATVADPDGTTRNHVLIEALPHCSDASLLTWPAAQPAYSCLPDLTDTWTHPAPTHPPHPLPTTPPAHLSWPPIPPPQPSHRRELTRRPHPSLLALTSASRAHTVHLVHTLTAANVEDGVWSLLISLNASVY